MDENFKTQKLNWIIYRFLSDVHDLFAQNNTLPSWQKDKVHQEILHLLMPEDNLKSTLENLENLLKSTLFNEGEKRRRQNYFKKDLSPIIHSSLLFENAKHSFMEHSFLQQEVKEESVQPEESPWNELIQLEENSDDSQKEQMEQEEESYFIPESAPIQFGKNKIKRKKGDEAMRKSQRRGRKPVDPEMEMNLMNWLKKQIGKESYLTQKIIREKAMDFSNSRQFKASKGWLQKFFKRHPSLFQMYMKNKAQMQKQQEKMRNEVLNMAANKIDQY